MRRMTLWRAGAAMALLLTGIAGAAPLKLTGTQYAQVHNVSNRDVYIYNATLQPGLGGVKTLTVNVTNGKIVVGVDPDNPSNPGTTGLDASGADGLDGQYVVPPGAGQAAGDGLNVTLLTTSSGGGSLTDCSIYIYRGIDCSGGDGGDGYKGDDGDYYNCAHINVESGTEAAAGGHGGNISITAAGDIINSGGLNTSGGNGGTGGEGGAGQTGAGGVGKEGRDGGNAGTISLVQSGAPALSGITLQSTANPTGSVTANGGAGGSGGAGGGGSPPSPGGKGGDGGNGGAIVVNGKKLTMIAGTGSPEIASRGGPAGPGADGGSGLSSVCVEHYCNGQIDHSHSVEGKGGADSGLGGSGGAGGNVTITCVNAFTMGAGCGVGTDGGDGASPGMAGAGGMHRGDACDDPITDCKEWGYLSPGQTYGAGDGGNAGGVIVSVYTLSINPTAGISATGGDGGLAVDGSPGGSDCCNHRWTMGQGGQGSEGGDGGNGGAIKLFYTVYSVTNDPYFSCGGLGTDGGDGANGESPGTGGVAGSCGAWGILYKNTVAQSDPCPSCTSLTGATGVIDDYPCQH